MIGVGFQFYIKLSSLINLMYDTSSIKLDCDFVSLQNRVLQEIIVDIDYEILEEHRQKIDIEISDKIHFQLQYEMTNV